MSYFCHSCQEQTDVIASTYLACQQCLSDFVEEIESTHADRTWSDEDETLAALWNNVFRNGLDDSPIPGSYPRQDNEYYDGDPYVASGDDEFHYAFAEYGSEDDQEEEDDEQNNEYIERLTYDGSDDGGDDDDSDSDSDSDYEEPQSPWPTHSSSNSQHYSEDDDDDHDDTYQDVSSYDEDDSADADEYLSLEINDDHYTDYVDDDDDGDDDDDDNEEYSLSSDEQEYTIDVRYEGSTLGDQYELSNNDDGDNEEEDEEEEEDDMVRAGQLMREWLSDEGNDEEYFDGGSRTGADELTPSEYSELITEINDYEDPPEDYHGSGFNISFDPAYHLSTLLRIIQEQHDAAFTDASNWETGSRDVVGASEDMIAALPRHQLAIGDTATQNECSICLNYLGSNVDLIDLPCKHGFHSACIEQWLQVNASCPVCRCPCS